MARRQLQIAGTERTQVEEVEKAAEAYREVRDERCELSKREKQKKLELLAVMRAHKVKKYKYDDENGEEILVSLDEREPDVSVKRTGEAEGEVGEGIPTSFADQNSGPPQGLIDQALKAQDDAGVAENDEGDVVVPDQAAPKKKGGKRSKRS